jgi:4-amino-4-deoxy-L-arabinose transferase-like glycosyltransferase
MRRYIFLSIIFLLACFLRFSELGEYGFFIDECLFIGMTQHISTQELVPSLIGQLTDTNDEFSTRFPFALAGSLTVLALYWVIKNKDIALVVALFYAVFPLFVFWSRLSRPYSMAGLFLVIAWRYPFAMIPAMFCTPIALIGLNLTHIRKKYIYLIIIAICIYFLREDANRGHFTIQNILYSTRWHYLPSLVGLLYTAEFIQYVRSFRLTAKKPVWRSNTK